MRSIQSSEEFEELIAQGNLVVVNFCSEWANACKPVTSRLEELSQAYSDITFVNADVDEASDVAQEQGIRSIPTVMFFKNDEKLGEILGNHPEKLYHAIEEYH